MNIFQFMGDHTFLTIILAIIISGCIQGVFRALAIMVRSIARRFGMGE